MWNGGILSRAKDKCYIVGIIDCFTEYNMKKKMEHNFKKIAQGPGISCVPPPEYSKRFCSFMSTIFE